ncbi:hypothetical protein [Winogradskyella sediminis]|uniref:hypothetical protein n=1 Tax=Winogradskyella sediminis TaxID=1382466 RepID=UPI000E24D421|nr:hypothetical protein [Winogradskyella sediminis]REG84120.1 hypothetical protein C8N41_10721 [Winogradskyella sediminis]
MKKILLTLIIGLLLANCADKKTESKAENDEVVETAESVIKNLGNTENGTLKIIDSYQELILKQNGNKCGEWGGDTKEIRIYKTEHNGKFFADYKNIIIDCKDPYSEKNKPKIIEKKEIILDESELNLAQESISELIKYKLTTEQRISHSGIGNYVISIDSTLIIEDWPSFGWPKFRELIKQIENK